MSLYAVCCFVRQMNIESPMWLSFRLQRRPAACAAIYYEMSQSAAHSTQMVQIILASVLASHAEAPICRAEAAGSRKGA